MNGKKQILDVSTVQERRGESSVTSLFMMNVKFGL